MKKFLLLNLFVSCFFVGVTFAGDSIPIEDPEKVKECYQKTVDPYLSSNILDNPKADFSILADVKTFHVGYTPYSYNESTHFVQYPWIPVKNPENPRIEFTGQLRGYYYLERLVQLKGAEFYVKVALAFEKKWDSECQPIHYPRSDKGVDSLSCATSGNPRCRKPKKNYRLITAKDLNKPFLKETILKDPRLIFPSCNVNVMVDLKSFGKNEKILMKNFAKRYLTRVYKDKGYIPHVQFTKTPKRDYTHFHTYDLTSFQNDGCEAENVRTSYYVTKEHYTGSETTSTSGPQGCRTTLVDLTEWSQLEECSVE